MTDCRPHKRPSRPRPTSRQSSMAYPMLVPKRSPSAGLRHRRHDAEIPLVDVGVQVGIDEDGYGDDLSTPELLEPPALPTAKIDWEIPRKALHSSIGKLAVLNMYLLTFFQDFWSCHCTFRVRILPRLSRHWPMDLR